MKTDINDLDDLVFRNRNKAYGAYANRKNYNRYMFWSLTIAISLFLLVVSAPLIANYISGTLIVVEEPRIIEDSLVFISDKVDPPDVPEPPKLKTVEPVYTAPIPTIDTLDLTDLFTQMEKVENKRPNDTGNVYVRVEPVEKPGIVETEKLETFVIVEEMPVFPGGDAGRVKYLSEHIKYPTAAREIGIEGKVHVTFVVDATGKVVEAELLRGIGGGCDEEALRVVSAMPDWKPGRQSGVAVRVKHTMAVNFVLR